MKNANLHIVANKVVWIENKVVWIEAQFQNYKTYRKFLEMIGPWEVRRIRRLVPLRYEGLIDEDKGAEIMQAVADWGNKP